MVFFYRNIYSCCKGVFQAEDTANDINLPEFQWYPSRWMSNLIILKSKNRSVKSKAIKNNCMTKSKATILSCIYKIVKKK